MFLAVDSPLLLVLLSSLGSLDVRSNQPIFQLRKLHRAFNMSVRLGICFLLWKQTLILKLKFLSVCLSSL